MDPLLAPLGAAVAVSAVTTAVLVACKRKRDDNSSGEPPALRARPDDADNADESDAEDGSVAERDVSPTPLEYERITQLEQLQKFKGRCVYVKSKETSEFVYVVYVNTSVEGTGPYNEPKLFVVMVDIGKITTYFSVHNDDELKERPFFVAPVPEDAPPKLDLPPAGSFRSVIIDKLSEAYLRCEVLRTDYESICAIADPNSL